MNSSHLFRNDGMDFDDYISKNRIKSILEKSKEQEKHFHSRLFANKSTMEMLENLGKILKKLKTENKELERKNEELERKNEELEKYNREKRELMEENSNNLEMFKKSEEELEYNSLLNVECYYLTKDGTIYTDNEKEIVRWNSNNNPGNVKDWIKTHNLTNSEIVECSIKNENNIPIDILKLNYNTIFKNILAQGKQTAINIEKNTKMNICFEKRDTKGFKYNWIPELGISFQSKDANGTMKEIINMCKINSLKLDILIELQNNKKISFKIV